MTNTITDTIIVAIFTSNALFGLIQWGITRYFARKDTIKQTLAAVSYAQLSDRIERRLDENYASPEQRKELDILYEAYKANGWNGDMEERMKKVYALPTKDLHRELKEIHAKLP